MGAAVEEPFAEHGWGCGCAWAGDVGSGEEVAAHVAEVWDPIDVYERGCRKVRGEDEVVREVWWRWGALHVWLVDIKDLGGCFRHGRRSSDGVVMVCCGAQEMLISFVMCQPLAELLLG